MTNRRESLFHGVKQCALRPALQHFRNKASTRRQGTQSEIEGEFSHRDDTDVIRRSMTGRVGSYVRKHQIG